MTIIKIAAVQISPLPYRREGTVEKIASKIIEYGRHATIPPCSRHQVAVNGGKHRGQPTEAQVDVGAELG